MAARAPRSKPAAGAPVAPRRRRGTLVLLGLLALVAFAAATLPASLASRLLRGQPVSVIAWSGTVWSGAARGVVASGVPVGDVRWTLHPTALLGLRLSADLELTRPDGHAMLHASARSRAQVELTDVELDLPLSALARSPRFGWNGRAQGRLDAVTLSGAWPTAVRGTLALRGVTGPAPMAGNLGDFELVFPDPGAAAATPGVISAHITGGMPLAVDASITIDAGRAFEVSGTVAGNGEVPLPLQRLLGVLGPADAAGRRAFSASGTL